MVLHVVTRFGSQVIDERFLPIGRPLRVGLDDAGPKGDADTVAVPVRDGGPHVARVRWQGVVCHVEDAAGQAHAVGPDRPAVFRSGAVEVTLAFAHRRAPRTFDPPTVGGGLAWFTIVLLATLLTSQAGWVGENFCTQAVELLPGVPEVGVPLAWASLPPIGAAVALVALVVADNWRTVAPALAAPLVGVLLPLGFQVTGLHWRSGDELLAGELQRCVPRPPDGLARNGGQDVADLIARLLKKDLDGEEEGVVSNDVQRPEEARDADGEDHHYFLPAGAAGSAEKMGGAAEQTLRPVRTVVVRAEPTAPKKRVRREAEIAPGELEAPRPESGQDAVTDAGAEREETDDAEELAEVPSEEDQGWGIPGWYDEVDREMEKMQIDLVLRMAQRQIRIDPDDLYALGILSYYQYLGQDFEGALATYDHMLELAPEDAATYNNKALVYKRRGAYEKEEGLYRQALLLDPEDDTALNNLAVNLAHQRRFEEALATMDRVDQMIPGDPYARLHRAKIYAEMGREDDAYAALREALTGMKQLDTLHHIEFRQDIRLDPSFRNLRKQARFKAMLVEFYGDDTPVPEGAE